LEKIRGGYHMKSRKLNLLIATGMAFTLLFAGCSANGNAANKTTNAAEVSKSASGEVKNEADTKEITDVKEKLKNHPSVQDFVITKKSDRVVAEINFKNDADANGVSAFIADFSGILRRAYKTNSAELKIMQNGNILSSVTVE
jgi:hypothetical protein